METAKHLNAALRSYIEQAILPQYDHFDRAHNRTHANTVIEQSLELAQHFNVDINMVYTVAAYHDTGLCHGREKHHIGSGCIVRSDTRLRQFFTQEQIETIACAVEDHRASNSDEPRTIYGKIVAEADRIIDAATIMARTIQYGLAHYPTLSTGEHIERAIAHIKEKYGRGGYLKLWVPQSANAERLEQFRTIIDNEPLLRDLLHLIYNKEMSPTEQI